MSEKIKNNAEFEENARKKIYSLILKAFEDFKDTHGEELDLVSLIRICIMCNCPSCETAEMALNQMVKDDFLERRKDETGRVLFRVKERADKT